MMESQSNTVYRKKGSLLLPILAAACHLLLPLTYILIVWFTYDIMFPALMSGRSSLPEWFSTGLELFQYGLMMMIPLQILAGIALGIVYLFTKPKRPIGYVLSISSIVHPIFWIGLIDILFSIGVIRFM